MTCCMCGEEIPTGWPVASYIVDGEYRVYHRFQTMCNQEKMKQVQILERWHELPDERPDMPKEGTHSG